MQTLNLFVEDFKNPEIFVDICNILNIDNYNGVASVLYIKAQDQLFNNINEIAVIWDIDDVKSLDLELDDDQCREVLIRAKKYHDAGLGINWDILEHHAHNVRNELIEKGAW
jgi:hypothetical protein